MVDSLDDVREVLQFVDANCTRENWVKVGDAIKGEFGDAGFDVWDHWSQGGDTYNAHAGKSTWRSIKGVVPMGWLVNLAKEQGWQPRKTELTPAEKRQRETEAVERRAQREQREKQQAIEEQEWHERVAEYCQALRARVKPVGKSKYLGGKKIGAFGLGFVARATGIVVDDEQGAVFDVDRHQSEHYFKERADHIWFAYISRGTIAVPMIDAAGTLWNYQFIFAAGKKKFIKHGRKKGLFHRFGDFSADLPIVIAEGYATAASCHMATGWPCVVAFDCGNLLPVATTIRELFPNDQLIIAGDDDVLTEGNPGRAKALAAAVAVGGVAVFPGFQSNLQNIPENIPTAAGASHG